jgi:hypothetical protein
MISRKISFTLAFLIGTAYSCVQISNVQLKNGNQLTDVSSHDEIIAEFKVDTGYENDGFNFNCDQMQDFAEGDSKKYL